MATNNIDILINARNKASRELKQVSSDLNSLEQTGNRLSALGRGLGVVGAVVGSAATLGMLAKTSVELAKVAGEFTTLKNSFDGLAAGVGASSDDMLNSLRNASQGMISDMSLVQSANRALLLGVADTSTEMAQLLQVAVVRGQAMGLSAEQAFNDIVTGIGRMSPMILDNLGIVTGGEQVYENFAASIGKVADELTDAEKKQALLNSVIASSQSIVDNATESATGGFQRLKASIDNAKVSLGLLFAEDFNIGAGRVAETIDSLIEKFTAFDQMLRDDYAQANLNNLSETEEHLQSIMNLIDDNKVIMDDLANQLIDAAIANDGSKFPAIKEQIDGLALSMRSLGERYNEMAAALGQQGLNLYALAKGQIYFQDIEQASGSVADAIDDVTEASGKAKAILVGNLEAANDAASGYDTAAVAAAALDWNAVRTVTTLNALANSLQKTKIESINFAGAVAAAFDTMSEVAGTRSGAKFGGLSDLIKTPLAMGDGMKAIALESGPAASGVMKVNQAFEDLKSTVSDIVSGAIGPVAGVDANDLLANMGMRPDAVNENARRLASLAVNGIDPKSQPWLEEFKNEVPGIWEEIANSDDPKAAAAKILKDFQDGLRPELIDKERAKELVRTALEGDKNTKQLIDEIAADLANEYGISLGEAKAKASEVLGGDTGGATGVSLAPQIDNAAAGAAASTFASAFTSAIEGGSLGADLGGALMVQITASLAMVEETGRTAGNGFIKGFTGTFDSIPTAFIAAVVSLAMPGIMSNINTNGGRTGAAET